MADHELFFSIIERPEEGDVPARIQVSAGHSFKLRDSQEGSGDILIYLSMPTPDPASLSGYLAYPQRAELEFDGTLQDMKALWMSTGNRSQFLRDPRFQFTLM